MEKKYAEAPEAEEKDSVLDIIYADRRRISTFVSQFNNFGSLTSITHSRRATRGKADEVKAGGGGNVLVAKGEGSYSAKNTAGHDEASEKTFDPSWSNTLNFLDEAQHRGLINRDVSSANTGELVLVTGPMRVRDLGLMGRIWNLPSFKAFTQAGVSNENRQQRRSKNAKSLSNSPREIDLIFDLISVLPHSLQATIGVNEKVWCLLDQEFLITSASDFVLKYGSNIPSSWGLLGILDARPNSSPLREDVTPAPPLDQISDVMLSHIEPLARQFLGRPADAYGLTPLVLFRNVGAPES